MKRSYIFLVLFIFLAKMFFLSDIALCAQEDIPQILEEFNRIDKMIEDLKNEVKNYNDTVEKRVGSLEIQLKDVSKKLDAMEKDFQEFKLWVREQEKEHEEFERQMSEGVEIKGTITRP